MSHEPLSRARFVFVSYRREDTESTSELLYMQLVERFRSGGVLKDIHDISLGEDFREWIARNVRACCAMLVVIGPRWVRTLQERREKGQEDYVLVELMEARRNGVQAFAVLVDGAVPPSPGDLPPELIDFTFAHSFVIPRPPHFKTGVADLASRLSRQFPELIESEHRAAPDHVQRSRAWLCASVLTVLGVAAWNAFAPPQKPDGARLASLLHDTIWVEYSPPGEEVFSWLKGEEQSAMREEIEENLKSLKKEGFTGILANGDTGVTHLIPQVAKSFGLKVIVICGLTGTRENREQTLARIFSLREFSDAFCIGYDRLGKDYQLDELKKAVHRMKQRSGLPVATTQPISSYFDNSDLVHVGDWLFPDVCLDLIASEPYEIPPSQVSGQSKDFGTPHSVDVSRDIERFMTSARQMAKIAKKEDKTLVFNGVAYPHSEVQGASENVQAEFFARLLDALQIQPGGPDAPASIIVHSSHDRWWRVFYTDISRAGELRPGMRPWMGDTGILSWNNKPLPAVREILKRHPMWHPIMSDDEPGRDDAN